MSDGYSGSKQSMTTWRRRFLRKMGYEVMTKTKEDVVYDDVPNMKQARDWMLREQVK